MLKIAVVLQASFHGAHYRLRLAFVNRRRLSCEEKRDNSKVKREAPSPGLYNYLIKQNTEIRNGNQKICSSILVRYPVIEYQQVNYDVWNEQASEALEFHHPTFFP